MPKTKDVLDGLTKELDDLQTKIKFSKDENRDIKNQTENAKLKLIQAENKLHEAEVKTEEAGKAYKSKMTVLEELKKSINKEQQDHHDKIKVLDEQIATLRANQKTLEGDIKNRTSYQREQEAQIALVIESGNDRILDLNHEAIELEKRKNDLEILMVDAEERLPAVQQVVKQHEEKIEELNKQYLKVNKTYQSTLNGLKTRIEQANEEHKVIVSKGQEIIKRLEIKEEELNTREEILNRLEKSLADQNKQLGMKKRLYDVV